MTPAGVRRSGSGERGSVTLWMVTASFVMMTSVGLAVDLGGQVHAQQRAHDLAAQAARAGGQHVQAAPAIEGRSVQVDTSSARLAAEDYLTAAGVDGTVTLTGGDTITVRVSDVYDPRFLGLLGISHLDVTGSASARLVRSLAGTER
jgi:Putative Flp pilus-assembly TadE/G-like